MKCPKCKKDNVRAGAVVDHILWLHCQHCSHCWSTYLLTTGMIEVVEEIVYNMKPLDDYDAKVQKRLADEFAGVIGESK